MSGFKKQYIIKEGFSVELMNEKIKFREEYGMMPNSCIIDKAIFIGLIDQYFEQEVIEQDNLYNKFDALTEFCGMDLIVKERTGVNAIECIFVLSKVGKSAQ